ncbi:MAG: exonuclease domain-containing protein [Candidatus Puniceispirillales bacterium]
MNFVFYDLETTGRNSTWDQIIQVGAILVDDKFNEIERFEERCRLRSGVVPEPGALIVNNTSIEMLNNVNLSHYELIKKVQNIFNKWSPAIFIGYNTINFDEEFLRKTFFKLLFEPYITQFNGNRRIDVLGLARASKFYFPDCLKVALNEKGNQVFKLDQLTQLNNIIHNAHDAMGDVEATIEIATKIYENANRVWESGLKSSNKIDVDNFMLKNTVFCIDEYFFGKYSSHVVTFVCKNYFNYPQCFDLMHDPIDYFDLSIKELKIKMKLRPKFIREVKNNKNPILMDKDFFEKIPIYKEIGLATLQERAELIKKNPDFCNKMQTIFFEEYEEKQITKSQLDSLPEDTLYFGGFPDNHDKSKMIDFHNVDWEEKYYISNQFRDQRFKYFAQRLIYEEASFVLPKNDYENIHKIIANQILSNDNNKWNSIPKSYQQLDTLRNQYEEKGDFAKLEFLEDLDNFLQQLEKNFNTI